METKFCALFVALLTATMAEAAENFDGSHKMICQTFQNDDRLLPTKSCNDLILVIDVENKTLKSPYRIDVLTIKSIANKTTSLVLRGTDVGIAWRATVHRTTGQLTFAILEAEVSYVVFAQCRLAPES